MNSAWRNNVIRLVLLLVLQVLLFKRMSFEIGSFGFMHFMIYPLVILLMPLNTPRPLLITLGFVLGIIVDMFYDSPGVHASAITLMAYARGYVLNYLEPFEGYGVNDIPSVNKFGLQWYVIYVGILLFLFLLTFFTSSYFSFVYIFEIMINTVLSFIGSYIVIMLYTLIFNPR